MYTDIDTKIHEYCVQQRRLLELELRSEQEESVTATTPTPSNSNSNSNKDNGSDGNGDTPNESNTNTRILRNLEVDHLEVGLMGRTVVQFISASASASSNSMLGTNQNDETRESSKNCDAHAHTSNQIHLLPAHRLTVGDEVEIVTKLSQIPSQSNENTHDGSSHKKRGNNRGGVISQVTETSISIALYENNNSHHYQQYNNSNDKQPQQKKSKLKGKKTKENANKDTDMDDHMKELSGGGWILVPKSSIQVHKKLLNALDQLKKFGANHDIAGRIIANVFQEDHDHEVDPGNESRSGATSIRSRHVDSIGDGDGDSDGEDTDEARDGDHWKQTESSFSWKPFNQNLDTSQKEAIQHALNINHASASSSSNYQHQHPITLIHGPPGTGKTTTVAELIHQAVHVHNMKVLVTAPSNVAVDNVLERLVAHQENGTVGTGRPRIRAVRIGHPARIQPSILPYSLESLVQTAEGTEIVNDIRSEYQQNLQIASNPKGRFAEKKAAYKELKLLRKELREREGKVVRGLMESAQVVLCTNVGAANSILDKYGPNSSSGAKSGFDLVVIDEAAQALEVSCWIPMLRGRRVVLAGDHCQLPPTIKSRHGEVQRELSRTLFERIMYKSKQKIWKERKDRKKGGRRSVDVARMLKVQYRMHEDIANWCSRAMYSGKLVSHDSVKGRKLHHLSHVSDPTNDDDDEDQNKVDKDEGDISLLSTTMNATLLLVDTAGCDLHESVNSAGSRFNEGEADIVAKHVHNLIDIGMKPKDIAVITPYNGQVEILRRLLLEDFPKLEIRSVDGFQGGEREAVVLSLVRSSDRGKDGIGFLADKRRLNVAVTRAKRQCAVICDSDTVSQNAFLKDLVTWMEDNGEYLSAMEYIEEDPLMKVENLTPSVAKDISKTLSSNDGNEKEISEGDKMSPNANNQSGSSDGTGGTNEYAVLSDAELEIMKQDLAERIGFFAEIADFGEEMEIEVACVDIIMDHLHFLCKEHELQSQMNGEAVDQHQIVTLLKTDCVLGFDNIQEALSTFAEKSVSDEEQYILPATQDVDVARLYNLCDSLGLSCQNEFGNYLIRPMQCKDSNIGFSSEDKDKRVDEEAHVERRVDSVPSLKDEIVTKDVSSSIEAAQGVKHKQDSAPNMNSLLRNLAKEREARAMKSSGCVISNEPSKKSKKTKGKKGKKAPNKKANSKDDSVDDDQDDFAFLDAQIEKVQTSHGRKIDAAGSSYKTIVNGLLISKPKPKEKKRDTRSSNALNAKIKQAQKSRKSKAKKK